MVKDRDILAYEEFCITPLKKSNLVISYYISTLIITLAICFIACLYGFIYLGIVG